MRTQLSLLMASQGEICEAGRRQEAATADVLELVQEMHTAQIESMPWTEKTDIQGSTLQVDTQYLDARGELAPAIAAEQQRSHARYG